MTATPRATTGYHDWRHTEECLLEMARLMHGASVTGHRLTQRGVALGLISAILHDTGYIQLKEDNRGTGAKYTLTHVERSIDFMEEYFLQKKFSSSDFLFCKNCLHCTGVNVNISEIQFESPENEQMSKILEKEKAILTLMPGALPGSSGKSRSSKPGDCTVIKLADPCAAFSPKTITETAENDQSLEDADVIISAGMGIREEKNLDLLRETSSIFSNAAIAGSRIVCDHGWLPYSRQVGETGKRVSPKLYLACGISGAYQHIAGMKQSQWIVAINTDPMAPIFKIADYGIVEDLRTFLPLLVRQYHELFGETKQTRWMRIPGIAPTGARAILAARKKASSSSLEALPKIGVEPSRPARYILLDGRQPEFQLGLF